MREKAEEKGKFTARHMVWLLVGAFAVVAAVNGAFIYAALESWTGVVEKEAYSKGLAYNEVLDQRARQRARGWQASLAVSAQAEGGTLIELHLSDKAGAPLAGARVNAELRRPTQAKLDLMVDLSETRPGTYAATARFPAKGQWDLRLTADRAGEQFKAEQRVSVF